MSRIMIETTEIYRGVLEFDYQPSTYDSVNRCTIATGPVETRRMMIGPYSRTNDIKSYVTRNRNKTYYKNLRLVRLERAAQWEEVV